jgi:hypothetical protein
MNADLQYHHIQAATATKYLKNLNSADYTFSAFLKRNLHFYALSI